MILWFIVYFAIVVLLGLGTYYCDAWTYPNITFLIGMAVIILIFMSVNIRKLCSYNKNENIRRDEIRDINKNINKSLCETVPAMMTGLGLLGTFLGLIFGLKNFNTDYEFIQNSISELLAAIKTAFITSIYGVSFSMFFNAMFKAEYSKLKNNIDSFYDDSSIQEFNKIDDNIMSVETNVEIIKKTIVDDAKDKYKEASIYGNIKTLEANVKAIKGTITDGEECIDQNIKSLETTAKDIKRIISDDITEQFNNSLKQMTDIVVDFMDSFADKQKELLDALVEQYFTRMNEEIFGKQLTELRTILSSINTESNKIADNMRLLSDNLTEVSNTLKSTNDNYSRLNTEFVSYLGQVNQYQVIITQSNESLNENLKELTDKYNETLVNTNDLADINSKLTEDVKQLTGSCELLRNESETSRSNRADLIEFVKDLTDTSNKNRSAMVDKVNELVSGIESRTKEFINKSSELITTTSDNTNMITDKLYNTLNESYENYSKMNDTFSSYIDRVNQYQENITSANNTLNEKLIVLTNKYEEQNNNAHDIITVTKTLTDNIIKLSESCHLLKSESEASRDNRENLRETIADMVRTSNDNNSKMYSSIRELVDTISDQTTDLISKSRVLLEEITNSSHEISKDLYDTVHGSLEEKTTSLREAAATLKNSVDTLDKNYSDVTAKLNTGLGKTFEEFDTNIAFFANRFYALINEMLSVANNIPEQLRQNTSKVYEDMARLKSENALDELHDEDSLSIEVPSDMVNEHSKKPKK